MPSREMMVIGGYLEEETRCEGTGNSIASGLETQAKNIRSWQNSFGAVVTSTLSANEQQMVIDHEQSHMELPPESSITVAGNTMINWEIVADGLTETASDVRDIVGGKTARRLPGKTVGQANQGEVGSEVIDVFAAYDPEVAGVTVIDTSELGGTVDHEIRHGLQAKEWNASVVNIDGIGKLTRRAVSEVDAMSEEDSQKGDAPPPMVHESYKRMWDQVTSIVSLSDAKEAAMSGDLVGLAEKAVEKRYGTVKGRQRSDQGDLSIQA